MNVDVINLMMDIDLCRPCCKTNVLFLNETVFIITSVIVVMRVETPCCNLYGRVHLFTY